MGSTESVSTGTVSSTAVGATDESVITDCFMRGLVDGMRCGILVVDRERRIVLCNDLAVEVLGLDAKPPTGMAIDEALPDYRTSIVRLLSDAFAMSTLPNRAEITIEREGGRKTIGFTMSMVGSPDGESTLGAAMFFKDLTLIEEREEQDRLKERLAALGQMAASMAHEIRNPLAGIDVTCALLRRKLGPQAEGIDLLNKVSAEVKRLNRTISSSLEYVRPVALDLAVGDLARVLNEAASVARRRVGGRGSLSVSVEREFPPFVLDRERMRQVFENLILNALEAIDDAGSVRVTLRRETRARGPLEPFQAEAAVTDPWLEATSVACVTVEDDGPGIAEGRRDRVFYPFYTTKEKGSGVGLATAKKIVDGHRGSIDLGESSDGGASFVVRLPIVLEVAEVRGT